MPDQNIPRHSFWSTLAKSPLLLPGNPMPATLDLEGTSMTTSERKQVSIGWLLQVITVGSAVLLILIGIGVYLWFGSLWSLVITASLGAIFLLILFAIYYMLARRSQQESVLTVSKRYAITWWDRAEDEDWKVRQLRNIILYIVFTLIGFVVLAKFVVTGLQAAPSGNFADILRIGGGVFLVILVGIGIFTISRKHIGVLSGTRRNWTTIVIALLMIMLGIWLFYGGQFPANWSFLHLRQTKASLAPIISLVVVAFFGFFAWLAARHRRIEAARDVTVMGAVIFWVIALFDLLGPAAIPLTIAVPALILIALFIYILLRIARQISESLYTLFESLVQFISALFRLVARSVNMVREFILNWKFWQQVDAWIDLRGEQLRILGQYLQAWTEILLDWANDIITLEKAKDEWTAEKAKRNSVRVKARNEYEDRLEEIRRQ